MTCRAEQRSRVRRSAAALRQLPCVQAVEVLDPYTDSTDSWSLEVTLSTDDGAPPPVISALAAHELIVSQICPRAGHWHVVATV